MAHSFSSDDCLPTIPVWDASFLRRHKQLRHLSNLSRNDRKSLLISGGQERQQAHLLRKADEKVRTLARKNRHLSIMHCKGESRRVQKQGRGKCGWHLLGDLCEEGEAAVDVETSFTLGMSEAETIVSTDRWHVAVVLANQCAPSLWDMAVARAARKAADYNLMAPVFRSIAARIANAKVAARTAFAKVIRDILGQFEYFREMLLERYGHQIRESLGPRFQDVDLTPVPLAPDVQRRFLKACSSEGEDSDGVPYSLRPAFHGTKEENLQSILARGLLIPGDGNEIGVANGSAHGLGIYVGKLGVDGCRLSFGFCMGGPMLVCGVIDDAIPVSNQLGSFHVSAESKRVKHVGSAMVIFESSCVVPLFVVRPVTCQAPDVPIASRAWPLVKHAKCYWSMYCKDARISRARWLSRIARATARAPGYGYSSSYCTGYSWSIPNIRLSSRRQKRIPKQRSTPRSRNVCSKH